MYKGVVGDRSIEGIDIFPDNHFVVLVQYNSLYRRRLVFVEIDVLYAYFVFIDSALNESLQNGPYIPQNVTRRCSITETRVLIHTTQFHTGWR